MIHGLPGHPDSSGCMFTSNNGMSFFHFQSVELMIHTKLFKFKQTEEIFKVKLLWFCFFFCLESFFSFACDVARLVEVLVLKLARSTIVASPKYFTANKGRAGQGRVGWGTLPFSHHHHCLASATLASMASKPWWPFFHAPSWLFFLPSFLWGRVTAGERRSREKRSRGLCDPLTELPLRSRNNAMTQQTECREANAGLRKNLARSKNWIEDPEKSLQQQKLWKCSDNFAFTNRFLVKEL